MNKHVWLFLFVGIVGWILSGCRAPCVPPEPSLRVTPTLIDDQSFEASIIGDVGFTYTLFLWGTEEIGKEGGCGDPTPHTAEALEISLYREGQRDRMIDWPFGRESHSFNGDLVISNLSPNTDYLIYFDAVMDGAFWGRIDSFAFTTLENGGCGLTCVNGTINQPAGFDCYCDCDEGWTGTSCERDTTDPCAGIVRSTDYINYPAGDIRQASTFVINETVYIVGGSTPTGDFPSNPYRLSFQNYPNASWEPIAPFPTSLRAGVGFSLGGQGFAGLGVQGDSLSREIYRYDDMNDRWELFTVFPSLARRDPIVLPLSDTRVLIGGGFGEDSEFVRTCFVGEIVGDTMSWTRVFNFPGGDRSGPLCVVVDGRGFAGLGRGSDGSLRNDWYEFDPNTTEWIARAAFQGESPADGIGFGMRGKIIIDGDPLTSVHQYDLSTDTWCNQTSFLGAEAGCWFTPITLNGESHGYYSWGVPTGLTSVVRLE